LRKPGLLALLLVMGVPAFSFWPLVGLVFGPSFIVPLWAASIDLALLLGTMGVLIVHLEREVRGDVRRVQNFRLVKCSICDEALPEASLRQFARIQGPHYQAVHPEMWRWNRRWRKAFIGGWTVLLVYFVGATVYAFSHGNPLLLVLTLLPPAMLPVFLMSLFSRMKRKQFRREWQNRSLG